MANKQASKSNKTAPSATVRREDKPGFKKVTRNKKRGTGVARVQQGTSLMDAMIKGDRGFDGDRASSRPARPASQWKEIRYGATRPVHEIRAVDRRNKMEKVVAATAAAPVAVAVSSVTTTTKAPEQRRFVRASDQSLKALEYPPVAMLKLGSPEHIVFGEVLKAFQSARATQELKKFQVACKTAEAELAKTAPEVAANTKVVGDTEQLAKRALNWAFDKLSKPGRSAK